MPLNLAAQRRERRLRWTCFLGALCVYAVTRFVALERFPIYFFCDEAIHTVCADELAAHHLRSPEGELLPTFFRNFFKYNLSLSVYVQGLSEWLLGKSIWTVRATSALFSLTGAAALAWTLRSVFRLREWWLGPMLLAVTPVWLVHSRTGFETALMVSCYAWFLCFYLLYRYRDPRWIFAAMAAGAGAFYAYANGQGVMAFSAVGLLVSDAPYHWRRRRWASAGLAMAFVLFLPYVRFQRNHPGFLEEHLRDLDSFAAQPLPWRRKAAIYLGNYLHGLSPAYWFFPGQEELVRHTAPGYGHFFTWLLPFFALGVGICLWRRRESRHRALLVAMLAAPFSAAMAGISAYRTLEFVIPANAAIALGISLVLERVRSRPLVLTARGGVFAGLTLAGFTLLADCFAYGPTVSADYGMFGMQWGGRELMRDAVPRLLRVFPSARIHIVPTWANGIDVFMPFFNLPPNRVLTASLEDIRTGVWDGTDDDLLILPPDQLPKLAKCTLYDPFEPMGRLDRPDGRAGFCVGRLRHCTDWREKLAALNRLQSAPITSELTINGQPVSVQHPPFEIGTAEELFDDDPYTTPRCYRGVPMVIELRFPQPRCLDSVIVCHRELTDFRQRVTAYRGETVVCSQEDCDESKIKDPMVRVPLAGRALDRIRIEVDQGPDSWVHLRDIKLVEEAAPTTARLTQRAAANPASH